MDQPRRLLLFVTLSIGFLLLWGNFVLPKAAPEKAAPAVGENKNGEANDPAEPDGTGAEGAGQAVGENGDAPEGGEQAVAAAAEVLTEAEPSTVTIGSTGPDSGYYLEATITSKGAAIESVRLSDPKFLELDRSGPLKLVGDTPTTLKTFSTGIDVIDAELAKQKRSLEDWNWEYLADQTAQTDGVNTKVVFGVTIAGIEVRKTYSVSKVNLADDEDAKLKRLDHVSGYLMDCQLSFRNVGKAATEFTYQLQGPVGVDMENEEHARETRKLQIAFQADSDSSATAIPAGTIVSQFDDDELESWQTPFRYVGVDNTFFVALLVADSEQRTIAQVDPMVVGEVNRKQESLTDISLRLTSEPVTLAPNTSKTHNYQFFVGPKRRELLDQPPLEAKTVLNLGYTGPIARIMLSLLGFFHNLGMPYGIAIMCLTVLVRGCMFPLSKRQALSAQKMKELQPEIQALKDKYGDDKQKIAQAQMELFAKHKYNPFAGCFPLLFQFPIFIGLYTALYHAVDLRLAKFLWIDNLAAPDATFRLPMSLPFLGQDFNILPIITVGLFVTQQKLFMPEPQNEEQALQQKLMGYMTLAFGFFFWHSPAGLCLYFIASSTWGITERKLLARSTDKADAQGSAKTASSEPDKKPLAVRLKDKNGSKVQEKGNKDTNGEDKEPGFFKKIWLEAQEAAAQANETGTQKRDPGNKGKDKKKKRR